MMLVIAVFLLASSLTAGAIPISMRQASNKTWTQVDMYQGQSFLDQWKFETYPNGDPTHGYVNYLDQADALSKNLAKVDGKL